MNCLKNTPPCCLNVTLASSLFTESYTNTKCFEICSFYHCSRISQEKHANFCTEQSFFQRCAFRKTGTDQWTTQFYLIIPEQQNCPQKSSILENKETSHPMLTTSLPATWFTVDSKCISLSKQQKQMCKLALEHDWCLLRFFKEKENSRGKKPASDN